MTHNVPPGRHDSARAQTLCNGRCHFSTVENVGDPQRLTVTDLRPGTTYYYMVSATNQTGAGILLEPLTPTPPYDHAADGSRWAGGLAPFDCS